LIEIFQPWESKMINHQLIQLAKYFNQAVLVVDIKPLDIDMLIGIFHKPHLHMCNHLHIFNPHILRTHSTHFAAV
jgi:hypothetical protein